MMVNYKLLSRTTTFVIIILFLVGCDTIEPKLNLPLSKQAVEQPFSFSDYYDGSCDSIYIIYPYYDGNIIRALPYKMSKKLKNKCSYTDSDAFVRILFIADGAVKAYDEVSCAEVYFSSIKFPNTNHIFPFKQKFILDKEREASVYKEPDK